MNDVALFLILWALVSGPWSLFLGAALGRL